MKVNIEIVSKALVHEPLKLECLNEKVLVQKMVTRRRLTRNSKILIYLASKCNFTEGVMIYGSAYGEVVDTASILNSIKNNEAVSPTAFQNSVCNTAASYHSIVHKNTSEVLTLSCGDNTSFNVMQQAALTLLRQDEVFVCVSESINFEGTNSLNKCENEREYAIAFRLRKTDKNFDIEVDSKGQAGVPASLSWMKNLYDICSENSVVEVTL